MGGFFVPGQSEYSLPTSDSLSQSFGGFQAYSAQTPSYAQPASYASQNNVGVNYGGFGPSTGTPSMGISPTEVSNLGMLASSPNTSAPVTTKGKHPDGDGLSEKRRRRRESHNAVERRRRDNINERIGELAGLIPGVLFECDGKSSSSQLSTSKERPTIRSLNITCLILPLHSATYSPNFTYSPQHFTRGKQ